MDQYIIILSAVLILLLIHILCVKRNKYIERFAPTPSTNDGWLEAVEVDNFTVPSHGYQMMSWDSDIPPNLHPYRTAESSLAGTQGSPICKDGCYQIKCVGQACNKKEPILVRVIDKIINQGTPSSKPASFNVNKYAYDLIVNETNSYTNPPTFYYKQVSCEDMKSDDPNPIVNN